MIDVILLSLVAGLIGKWFVADMSIGENLQYYTKVKWFGKKPWVCELCMSFWIGVGFMLYFWAGPNYLLVPFAGSAIGVLISRI